MKTIKTFPTVISKTLKSGKVHNAVVIGVTENGDYQLAAKKGTSTLPKDKVDGYSINKEATAAYRAAEKADPEPAAPKATAEEKAAAKAERIAKVTKAAEDAGLRVKPKGVDPSTLFIYADKVMMAVRVSREGVTAYLRKAIADEVADLCTTNKPQAKNPTEATVTVVADKVPEFLNRYAELAPTKGVKPRANAKKAAEAEPAQAAK